jgi:hypothetical protein
MMESQGKPCREFFVHPHFRRLPDGRQVFVDGYKRQGPEPRPPSSEEDEEKEK